MGRNNHKCSNDALRKIRYFGVHHRNSDLMKIKTFKAIFVGISAALASHAVSAQSDLDKLLQEDLGESKILIGEYISPFMKSVSLGLNQGWYNTAKNHKPFGVDLTVTVSAMTIPTDEEFVNIKGLGLKSFDVAQDNPFGDDSPTIFGPDESSRLVYNVRDADGDIVSQEAFDGPRGLGMKDEIGKNLMPVPIANLGIGLPKGTDLKIRFVPTLKIGDEGEFKLWGVGVMHDVKQWIPGIKLLPFDLAGFVGHTRLSMEYRPDVTEQEVEGENQRNEFSINATTIQALISKKFSVLTLYGGLGYNIAKSNLAVKGTYDINENNTYEAYEIDPLDYTFSASGFRATAGFRLKLAVLTIHADYTLQKYKAISAGIGISVR
jgi:hypothetical protein